MSSQLSQPSRRVLLALVLPLLASALAAGCVRIASSEPATPAATLSPEVGPPAGAMPGAAPATYWPTTEWRTSTPEEQGMDSQMLARMLDAINQQKLAMHSVLVIRNGYIVSETYYPPYTLDSRHELFSCTKSFIATLVGIAIDQGIIESVMPRVTDLLGGRSFQNQDSRKQAMTLDDLLTMRTGLDWIEADGTFGRLYSQRDWVQFVMDMPMRAAPGSSFNYCSGCSHVLSAIVQLKTGMNTRAFADKVLFEPLGIRKLNWETDSTGIPIGGWGLQITPRDMAKLGYLYLNNGQWDGRQIVSAQWVKDATRKHTDTGSQRGYGYQWWTYPSGDAYVALGRDGQTIFVLPDLQLIVVTTANLPNHDPIFDLIDKYIVPAVTQ